MRTDVKVGLFLGISALLLAGWMYWPSAINRTSPVVDPSRPVTVTFDLPARAGTPRGTSTVTPLTVPSAAPHGTPVATAVNPPAPVTAQPSSPGLFSPRTAEANVPVHPTESVTATPITPAPSIAQAADVGSPAALAPVASASAEAAGPATIGRESLLHIVKSGQTLEQIADQYYKESGKAYDQAAMVSLLRQVNPQVAKGRQLRAGTKIKIPDPATPLAQTAPASPTGAAPGPAVPSLATVTAPVAASVNSPATQSASVPLAGAREYKVQRGDTLYSIASKQLGASKRWQEVMDLNNTTLGGKPQGLRPGQVLRLPS
jgi:nucleoid-associated protein YgaU